MPKKKGYRVKVEVPPDLLESVPEEELSELLKDIVETHLRALRIAMRSPKNAKNGDK